MKKFGLIGYPLGHSFSEKYFTEKFKKENLKHYVYELFPIQNLSELPALLEHQKDLCGLNVTIPHKIGVMYYLDEIDKDAQAIDAVNCIKVTHHHSVQSLFSGELCKLNAYKPKLIGYNTDAYGFELSLVPLLKSHHKNALILGNGGAARAVKFVLEKLDIEYKFVSRRPLNNMLSYEELNKNILKEYQIIINTTPLGTFPKVEECAPIPYQFITSKHLLYDLIYNPAESLFLRKGKEKGAQIKNGEEMLRLQADKSWEIWNS
ncbi:MAG: shikimate dehydrogenase [Sphingobacteriales bacterium]|nr:shikimate dehydrogenase [Sphingobacteriales bacterium]